MKRFEEIEKQKTDQILDEIGGLTELLRNNGDILFLIKNADEELTQTWLGLGLTAIDIILIVLMFRGI